MAIDFYNLKSNEKTWDLLETGKTAGVFQLDNIDLSARFTKKICPESIDDISAITTIIRPGTLNSELDDGESCAIHYERRHRGVEEAEAFHPLLHDLLKDTQQIILYQEQTIKIARELAGFDGKQAMKLMKGIGKKKADLIMELEKDFVEGCVKNDITQMDAQKIFNIIKKSARYSFNKSHAVAYSMISYADAYVKANHMTIFYVASLRMGRHKINSKAQIKKLVKEAAEFNIVTKPPRLENCFVDFTARNKKIYFGISNIKGIGEAQAQLIVDISENIPDTWYECLFRLFSIKKTTVKNCINAGVFARYKVPVRRQLDDFNNLLLLTKGQKQIAVQNHEDFEDFKSLLEYVKTKTAKNQQEKMDSIIKLIDQPAEYLEDNLRDTTKNEVELFGCTVSFDNIDTITMTGNCDVQAYKDGKYRKEYDMVVEVGRLKTHEITKGPSKGKMMAFVTVFDHTDKMDVCLFDSAYDEFGGLIYEGSTIMIKGYRGKTKGLVVNEVLQVT